MEPTEYATLMRVLKGKQKLAPTESVELAGPPQPKEYAPQPIEGREYERPEGFGDFMKDIGPVLTAQLLDGLSTEIAMKRPLLVTESGVPMIQNHEMNPLPGMGNTLGRIGWGVLENAAIHLLNKKKPKLGKAAKAAAIVGSTAMARMNFGGMEDLSPYHKYVHPFLVNRTW